MQDGGFYQWLATSALALLSGILGWLLKSLWAAVSALRENLQRLEVSLPKEYVAKTDLVQLRNEIMKRFDKLDEKLDGKADR